MIVIYCHTNRINKKSYVGQSCHGMKLRWQSHVNGAEKCDFYFARALRKYGPESFDHVQIEQHESQEDADEAEDFFIQYLGTMAPNGYNLKGGGASGKPCEEARQRQRIAQKNAWLKPEVKTRHSIAQKKFYEDPEERRKQSERQSFVAKKRYEENPNAHRQTSEGAKRRWANSEERQKLSEKAKKRFKDPKERRKLSEGRTKGAHDRHTKNGTFCQCKWCRTARREALVLVQQKDLNVPA